MGNKRSSAKGAAVGWGLAFVVVVYFVGWWFWSDWRKKTVPQKPAAPFTNTLDIARATNLLHWLNTNFVATTNASSKPIAAPPGIRTVTNHFPIATSNLVTVRTAAPPLFRTSTNLATTISPPLKGSTNTPASGTSERPVRNFLEAQIALARMAISCGPIDGMVGAQTRASIRAYQIDNELTPTGDLDSETKESLTIEEPVFTNYVILPADLARLRPLPTTWVGKSEAESLDYETILELVAEKHQASHNLIKSLNPSVNWTNISPFTSVKVPYVARPAPKRHAALVRISLAGKTLEAFDAETNLLAHFPCSIAARVEKRPVGQLLVVTGAENPNYTFDPTVFPESEEARQIDHRLIIPPGPNNPVGTAWITLDKPGYGIHGTPRPDQVGRTESHGCFRLANWNAEYLLKLVSSGTPVYVVP
jgi:lipoprotein-anchoring transpeptidase ErfK/SrfK